MTNIKVGRYSKDQGTVVPLDEECAALLAQGKAEHNEHPEHWHTEEGRVYLDGRHIGNVEQTWQGWIEDEERTWIAFIDRDGRPVFFLNRDENGGVIDGTAQG